MMPVRQLGLGALLLTAMALAGCSGSGGAQSMPASGGAPGGGAPADAPLTVTGTDQMRFDPATLTARANQPVSVTLDLLGAVLVHDFVIDGVGGQRVQILAQPHQQASGQFTLPAGTYPFYCSQPGHREAGMVGTLTVS
jgi:uncharacterized cupredoxin-like copper-binding protein